MKLIIRTTKEEANEWAAKFIVKQINDFRPGPRNYFVLALSIYSNALGLCSKLVEFYETGKVSFKFVKIFNLEEYVNLSENHPQSYHYKMWKHLFRQIDISPSNVIIPDGNVKDLVAECKQYENKIQNNGGFDLFLGEISPDGQLSFNEPASSLGSRTRVKNLAHVRKLERARQFENDVSKVPKRAISAGVGTIMDARNVVLYASGSDKAFALYKAVEENINHMVILSVFQKHPQTFIVCDKQATFELKVKTIDYFSSLCDPLTETAANRYSE